MSLPLLNGLPAAAAGLPPTTGNHLVTATDTSQVQNLGLVAIVVIVLVGLLIARLVTKLVVRVVVLLVVSCWRWWSTSSATGWPRAAKQCDASFFGIHVQPHDPDVRKACQQQ